MLALRRSVVFSSFLIFLFADRLAEASSVSDFQARLAQTNWNLQATERILRGFELSAVAQPTPEGLGSYLTLLSENVTALTALATPRATDEQRRVMAEGLKSVATHLKDQTSLAQNRGLNAAASVLSRLEASCRSAIGTL